VLPAWHSRIRVTDTEAVKRRYPFRFPVGNTPLRKFGRCSEFFEGRNSKAIIVDKLSIRGLEKRHEGDNHGANIHIVLFFPSNEVLKLREEARAVKV
jgi:hypothetical protein